MLELKSAKGDRAQHFANLNDWSRNGYPAREMLGKFWQIDAYTYDEALGQLPPGILSGRLPLDRVPDRRHRRHLHPRRRRLLVRLHR